MTSALTDEEFYEQARQGGASRDISTGNVPDRGYMVGGARTSGDLPFPEISHPVDSFSVDDVRHHARAIRDAFSGTPGVHQGAWVEGDKVILDASQQLRNKREAIKIAKQRGERAIYDVKHGTDIPTK